MKVRYGIATFLPVITLSQIVYAQTESPARTQSAWTPEPRGRGTWGLLSSCVITLFLCVWTATHGDVVNNGTPRKRLVTKVILMLLALFAPETIIIMSYKQWKEARELHKFWCDYRGIKRGSDKDQLGMEGAFFIVMGGFKAGSCDYSGLFLAAITTADFKRMTEEGCISLSAIHKKLIMDKGKADPIGKFLTLLQALSIVIQCATRKAAGLPVTLLEIHVVIQVFCAGVTYAFWWYKPLNVVEPMSLIDHGIAGGLPTLYDTEKETLMGIMPTPIQPVAGESERVDEWFIAGDNASGAPLKMLAEPIEIIIFGRNYCGQSTDIQPQRLNGTKWRTQNISDRRKGNDVLLLPGESLVNKSNFLLKYCGTGHGNIIILDKAYIEGLTVKANEIRDVTAKEHQPENQPDIEKGFTASTRRCWTAVTQPIVKEFTDRERVQSVAVLSRGIQDAADRTEIALPLFMLYGAAHCVAWNSLYPTAIEQLLWRISCGLLLGVPLCLGSMTLIFSFMKIKALKPSVIVGTFSMLVEFTMFFIPIASLFLIIESFISVRHLPEGAYKTATWEDIWPLI